MKHTIPTAALLAVLLPAAAGAQNREHLQMAAELRILQEQQVQLMLKLDQLTQAQAEAMKALNARLDQNHEALRKVLADQAFTLTNLGQELRSIRENGQSTSTRLGNLLEEIQALRQDVLALLSLARSTSFAPAPVDPLAPIDPNAPPAPTPPTPTALPTTAGLSPTVMFTTAMGDYGSGQFSLAISGFEQFIKTFPGSNRADDAQYQIGEAYYQQAQFEQALAAYNAVIQNYPREDYVPWAYYKRAETLRRLRRPDAEAIASYELAIKTAASTQTDVTTLARSRLEGLAKAPSVPSKP